MKTFIDLSPKNNMKCCYSCQYFSLWGVQTGHCKKFNKDKMAIDGKYCKSFNDKTLLS